MGKGGKGGKGTPDDLDYLFERDIVDEEDYVEFWSEYWKRDKTGREELVVEFLERYAETGESLEDTLERQLETPIKGTVVKSKLAAARQIQEFSKISKTQYKIVRRDARGRFSKRGRKFQAVRKK